MVYLEKNIVQTIKGILFTVGYFTSFYLTLWNLDKNLDMRFKESLIALGNYADKIKFALLVCPFYGYLLGLIITGFLLFLFVVTEVSKINQNLCCIGFFVGNLVAFRIGDLFIENQILLKWVSYVGQDKLHTLLYIYSPLMGVLCGIILTELLTLFVKPK